MRFFRLIIMVVCLTLAVAQQPQLTVNSYTLNQGEELSLRATNLEPNAAYTLTLTTPEGETTTRALRSDARGEVRYEGALQLSGDWMIALRGEDINAMLGVTVEEGASSQNPLSQNAESAEAATQTTPDTAQTPTTNQTEDTGTTQQTETAPTQTETNENTTQNSTETQEAETTPETQQSTTQPSGTEQPTTQQSTSEQGATETSPLNQTESRTTQQEPSQAETPTTETPATEPETTDSTTLTQPEQAQQPQGENNQAGQTQTGQETPTPALTSPVNVTLEQGTLTAIQDDETLWTLSFPPNSGETTGLAEFDDVLFLGHGNSVLKIDRTTGDITQRFIVSGQVTELGGAREMLTVTSSVGEGLTETFTIQNDQLQETVRFGNEAEVFTWLQNEANVEDVTGRLEQDTTNPWLYARAAAETTDATQSRNYYREAVNTTQTFYDSAKLATVLLDNNQTELANEAMEKARRDFAARGYDPRLLRDATVMQTYGFPVAEFEEAINQRDTAKADVYASWLSYFVAPDDTRINSLMGRYANLLRQQGNQERADEVRAYGGGARLTRIDNVFGVAANALGNAGWYGVLSLGVAILGLWLTLLFKYWSPHSLIVKRRQAAKKSVNPASRLLAIRYYSFTEKVFLVLLFASMLVLAALASWNERGRAAAQEAAFTTGTLSGPVAQNALVNLPDNQSSNFVRGYAAQVAGDENAARDFYQRAGDFGPALNNLGALTNDQALFQRAGNLPEARANLGEEVTLSPWQTFTVGTGQPLLVTPALSDVRAAAAGSWLESLGAMFSNPWTGLQNARPATVAPWLWTVLQVIFLILALFAVVWLFVPRPRLAANAPRNVIYHLLSLLIPGSGLADEMWGILLIVPWAVVSVDVLSDLLGWGLDIGITLRTGYIILAVIYLINLIAFVVEFNSYRRRMKGLRQSNPDLAREYGLRVRTATTMN
jgi:hypothetical protein